MDEKEFQKISKKTQDSLGKLIKKPPLTDKLLKKPPFRFLHDIITSVIRMTGFMKGLYTATEMNSENVKEKEAKIAFLQKAIDMVALVTGKVVSVKPNKIVSGHEPEKTNEFLQLLATAILKKVDNDEFVKRVLSSEKPGKSSVTKKDNEKKDDPKEKKRLQMKCDFLENWYVVVMSKVH
ncbi:TRAF3-interacting protein 1-like [Tubulanus polymorphus]|uniref:TRAF3-interacting protein 1-like n=1 Tax=Tubulanus polymorphus TaxID=672921 RepID=UPI003DA623A2